MQTLDLNGVWTLHGPVGGEVASLDAEVPGGVHPALIAAGLIPDPGIGDNAQDLTWVGETDWTFERPFDADAALLAHAIIDLDFDGIDTVSDVFVNDVLVLRTDNMFRSWSADVKDVLREGANVLRVEIKSPLRSLESGKLRKARYGFGSDYSPKCVTAGVCRPVHLRAWNEARICDLGLSQRHEEGSVTLLMGGWIEVAGEDFSGFKTAFVILSPEGEEIWRGEGEMLDGGDGSFNGHVTLDSPQLWWPHGMGEQPLYTIMSVLCNASGAELERITRRIGLRTLGVETDAAGVSRMMCNGRFVFLKGGVWIPPGLFPSHVMPDDYVFLVGSAVEAGLNSLRIWDGGTFEDEAFWDTCDENGIIVTGIAAMFSDSDDDDDEDDVRAMYRPFHHACLPDSLLTEPSEENGLRILRTHISYPHPDTLEACVSERDRNITGQAMESRVAGRGGATGLVSALAAQWPLPSSFRDWVWLSQIAHGVEVCADIRAKRRDPSCSGVMWEPFASCWAIADGSSIDSQGHWKALQYMAQSAFASVLISGVVCESGAVEIYLSNASPKTGSLKVEWRATTLSGLVLDEGDVDCSCPGGESALVLRLNVSSLLHQYSREDVMIWLTAVDEEGFTLSKNHVLFAPPKHLALADPHVAVDIDDTLSFEGEEAFKVTLCSTSPAFWVWLDIPSEEAQFSDNFVCLEPDETVEIYVSPVNRMTQFSFRNRLKVRSLYDVKRAGSC